MSIEIDLWTAANKGIQDLQGISPEKRKEFFAKGIPATIPYGDRQLLITNEGLRALQDLSERWRTRMKDRKATTTQESVQRLAQSVFGGMLYDHHESEPWPDTQTAITLFEDRLEKALSIVGGVDHYFPCHLFTGANEQNFSVGPIRFYARPSWLAHVQALAVNNQMEWLSQVAKIWAGEIHEIPADAPIYVKTVLDNIGQAEWIAAVTVKGNEPERAAMRARMAVRLAVDAVGVHFSRADSLKLRGPGDEMRLTVTGRLAQRSDGRFTMGFGVDRPVISPGADAITSFLNQTINYRAHAGWSIEAMLKLPAELRLPSLQQRWCDALHLFGEARRDSKEYLALMNYGMALDVLTQGAKYKGILAMLTILFDKSEADVIAKDGTTLKLAVKKIYDDGRSQFAHGGRPALLQEIPISLNLADSITQAALTIYLDYLVRYTGPDETKEFLKAIPTMQKPIE